MNYTITAALPYTNGGVHIGHLAGVYLPADIFSRYLRSRGKTVAFVCGSDEHGVPITLKARKEGISPQQVVDKYHHIIKQSFEDLGISFDIYHRTSDPIHHKTAADFFKTLYDKGVLVEKTTQQFFDTVANQFLADRYITGTCPKCGNEKAYGDQCERCGSTLNATDLISPRSTLSSSEPILKATKHWFLPLDSMQTRLSKWILEDHKDWKTNVYGQCKSWLDAGLQPRAVTRDLDWGVKIPLPDTEGKVLYVWFDAPIGYISATKALAIQKGLRWEDYWQNEDTRLIQFIGKDNIVFHCIIFPAMLMLHEGFILPENVPANEFLNLEGEKISTSRNWAVWLDEYVKDFPNQQDSLRYALCATMPETKDNDFTWKDFQARNNNELVATFGNFINRVVTLIHKYYGGMVPDLDVDILTDYDRKIIDEIALFPKKIGDSIEQYRFREALTELMNLARLGNKYLADTEPWKLIKVAPDVVKNILKIGVEITANLSILAEPFMPFTTQKLLFMLNAHKMNWDEAGRIDLLPKNHVINESQLLFSKIEDAQIEVQTQRLARIKAEQQADSKAVEPQKIDIIFDDFVKIDIRIGTIVAAEKVAKAKKLLKLTIDTGIDQRTVVSGIAEHYSPEAIVGQQVSILVNLAAREIKGIASQGMILMAEDADGKLRFLQPSQQIANGSTVS